MKVKEPYLRGLNKLAWKCVVFEKSGDWWFIAWKKEEPRTQIFPVCYRPLSGHWLPPQLRSMFESRLSFCFGIFVNFVHSARTDNVMCFLLLNIYECMPCLMAGIRPHVLAGIVVSYVALKIDSKINQVEHTFWSSLFFSRFCYQLGHSTELWAVAWHPGNCVLSKQDGFVAIFLSFISPHHLMVWFLSGCPQSKCHYVGS